MIEVNGLHVQQAALTGESMPVEKIAQDRQGAPQGLADATNMIFLGTSVVSGTATALVTVTGRATAFGDIAVRVAARPPERAGFSRAGRSLSAHGASFFLPFLPMLPIQILLNNFLYDLSQVTIPTDHVDESYIIKPRRWDMKLIRDFMIYIGPISSIYDFLTFFIMLG